jgi:anti-sigma factor RsiW
MSSLTEDDRKDLVAYLDGELDPKRARALEAKLNVDPQARAEAEALRQTWELLDYLPTAEPSPTFTHRTLERLAVQNLPPRPATPRPAWRRLLAGVAWAAAVLLAATLGYALGGVFCPAPPAPAPEAQGLEEEMVRHLRVLQNKRLYDLADDLQMVKALDDPDLFGDDPGS